VAAIYSYQPIGPDPEQAPETLPTKPETAAHQPQDSRMRLLSAVNAMPPLPAVLSQLLGMLSDDSCSSTEIAAMIETRQRTQRKRAALRELRLLRRFEPRLVYPPCGHAARFRHGPQSRPGVLDATHDAERPTRRQDLYDLLAARSGLRSDDPVSWRI